MLLLYIQLYLSHAYRLDVTSKQCMSNQFSNDGLESALLRTSLELINKLCNNLVPEFSVLPFVHSVKFVKCWKLKLPLPLLKLLFPSHYTFSACRMSMTDQNCISMILILYTCVLFTLYEPFFSFHMSSNFSLDLVIGISRSVFIKKHTFLFC